MSRFCPALRKILPGFYPVFLSGVCLSEYCLSRFFSMTGFRPGFRRKDCQLSACPSVQRRVRDFCTFDVLVCWHPGPATWFWNYSFDRSIKFIFDYFKPNLQFVKNYGLLQNTNSERLDLKSFEGINIFCNMGNSSCDFLCHLQTSQNHIIRILKNNSVSKDIQSNSYNKQHVLIPHTYVFFLILSS